MPDKQRRRQFVVDRKLQLSITTISVSVVCLVALLALSAVYFLPDERVFTDLSGLEARNLVLEISGLYLFLLLASMSIVIVLLTHRVAGPARVVREALEESLEGRYDKRLSLRKNDYLHDLAETATRVRSRLRDHDRSKRALLEEIGRTLEKEGSSAAIDVILRELGREPVGTR